MKDWAKSVIVKVTKPNRPKGSVQSLMNNSMTQDTKYRQSLLEYAKKHDVIL